MSSGPHFKSWRSYWDFDWSIRREQRFVRDSDAESFLAGVRATLSPRKTKLKVGSRFWRAQLGHDWREVDVPGGDPMPIPAAHTVKRMTPLLDSASEGRVNPKGIPCLYLATKKETAMSEVRPWVGSFVSVAQFELLKEVEIVDCTQGHAKNPIFLEEPDPAKITEAVWFHIDKAFATPVDPTDTSADYAPTQIIAELFKREGFGGLAYKSSFGVDGYNIALFDIGAAKLLNCQLHKVKSLAYEFGEEDSPYFVT